VNCCRIHGRRRRIRAHNCARGKMSCPDAYAFTSSTTTILTADDPPGSPHRD
jgi:hypothetical protein